MKKMLFSFEDLATGDKSTRIVSKSFSKAGAEVVDSSVSASVKRASGIGFREMYITFADSQTVTIRIKRTGDIYQVLLNKRVLPIKNQDNHVDAIAEIVSAMEAGRTKFQKLLARTKVKVPSGIRTTAPKIEQTLIQKRDALIAAIAEVRAEIETLKAA